MSHIYASWGKFISVGIGGTDSFSGAIVSNWFFSPFLLQPSFLYLETDLWYPDDDFLFDYFVLLQFASRAKKVKICPEVNEVSVTFILFFFSSGVRSCKSPEEVQTGTGKFSNKPVILRTQRSELHVQCNNCVSLCQADYF